MNPHNKTSQEAIKKYRAAGHGFSAIARALNGEGFRTPHGHKWNYTRVYYICKKLGVN